MLERLRFVRYALRFERAFRTDAWERVKECFHPDAEYVVAGAPPFDGTTRGPDAIVRLFQRMLNDFDRRFDARSPQLASCPRVTDGVLSLRWRVRYSASFGSVVLAGVSSCRFADGRIIELRDTMAPEDWTRALALVEAAGPRIARDPPEAGGPNGDQR